MSLVPSSTSASILLPSHVAHPAEIVAFAKSFPLYAARTHRTHMGNKSNFRELHQSIESPVTRVLSA